MKVKLNQFFDNIGTFYIIIGVIFFVILNMYLWNFTIDDAFISFQYASHLAQGYGLVWNIGEMPIEGYSNFLWVLLISLAFLFKMDPVIFARFINFASLLVILYIYWNISRDIFSDDKNLSYLCFSIGLLILLSNPATAIHFLSGLETFAYSALILAVAFLAYKIFMDPKTKNMLVFMIVSSSTVLLRPEGVLIVLGLFISMIFFFLKYRSNKEVINLSKSFLLFLVPISIYMIFRISYFNEIFPLPFLVKTINYGSIMSSISSLVLLCQYAIPLLLVIFLAVYGSFRIRDISLNTVSKEIKFIMLFMIMLIAIICVIIPYFNTSLMMNYAQRYFYPSLVLVYILSSVSFILVIKNLDIKINNSKTVLINIVLVLLLVSTNIYFVTDITSMKTYSDNLNAAHIPLGKSLEEFSNDNYTIVNIDSGAIPYFSKWKQVDLLGLNDRFIAKNHKLNIQYLENKNPDIILLISRDGVNIDFKTPNQEVAYEYAKMRNFKELSSIEFGKNYFLIPFINPNIKDYNSIVNKLMEVANFSNLKHSNNIL